MATKTTVTSGLELVKHLQEWSNSRMRPKILLCIIDVTDLLEIDKCFSLVFYKVNT